MMLKDDQPYPFAPRPRQAMRKLWTTPAPSLARSRPTNSSGSKEQKLLGVVVVVVVVRQVALVVQVVVKVVVGIKTYNKTQENKCLITQLSKTK